MKNLFIAVIISLSALSVAAAQKGNNDPVGRIKILGTLPPGIGWDTHIVIQQYAQKSATASELVQFLSVPKNVKACADAFGVGKQRRFCLIAIEPTKISMIIVKNGVVSKAKEFKYKDVNNVG